MGPVKSLFEFQRQLRVAMNFYKECLGVNSSTDGWRITYGAENESIIWLLHLLMELR